VPFPISWRTVPSWVARWCTFKPKIPPMVNIAGPCNRKGGIFYLWPLRITMYIITFIHTLRPFSNLAEIWYISPRFYIFPPVLVYFPPFWHTVSRKNLATLVPSSNLFKWLMSVFICPLLSRTSMHAESENNGQDRKSEKINWFASPTKVEKDKLGNRKK
jgi:hypothetical protein